MSISLTQVRRFIVAANVGRLTEAAEELHVTQAAMSSSIGALEDELGVKLFERRAHGVELTPIGRELLAYARQIEVATSDLLRAARFSGTTLTGNVRAATTFTGAAYVIAAKAVDFERAYPAVKLEIDEGSLEYTLQRLRENRADVAVLIGSASFRSLGFEVRPLLRSPRRLWLAPDHPLAHDANITLAKVAKYPYVMLTMDHTEEATMAFWSSRGLVPRTRYRLSALEGVREIIAKGGGVTILSDLVYRGWTVDGRRIVRRELDADIPPMEISAVQLASRTPSEAENAFLKFLTSETHPAST